MSESSSSSNRLQPALHLQQTQKFPPNAKKDSNLPEGCINNKLYPEIISLIFQFCVVGLEEWEEALHRIQYPDGYFTPLSLGAVCQSWRDIAWSTSSLWNRFFILLDEPASEQTQMTQQWLSRSGNLPLTLYMAHKNELRESYSPSEPHLSTMEAIYRYAHRWTHLFLFGNCEWISRICGNIPEGLLATTLQTLKLKPTKGAIGDLFHHQKVLPPFFGLSFALKRDSDLKAFIVDWSNVTRLELSWLNAKDCIDILTKAPRLTHLEMEDFHDESEAYGGSDFVPLVHHNLSYFKSSSRYSRFPCTKFLAMVTLPGLRKLYCQFIRLLPGEEESHTVEILMSFFKRSSCSLENLSLVHSSLADHELIRILSSTPSLRALHMVTPFWLDTGLSPGPLLDHLGENSAFLPNFRSLSYLFRRPNIPWSRFPDIFGDIDVILSKGSRRPLESLKIVSSTFPSAGQEYRGDDSESEDDDEIPFEDMDEVDLDLIDPSTVHRFMELKTAGIIINIYNVYTKQDLLKRSIDVHRIDVQ